MRPLHTAVIHCSATKPDWMENSEFQSQIDEIRKWHVEERKWNNIGYHFIIGRKGELGLGRPIEIVGAHVKGHNANSVGICLIGGHGSDADDKFSDHYTPEQDNTLRQLIEQLKAEYGVKVVRGHNSFEGVSKACPGFRVKKWLGNKETGRPEAKSVPSAKSTSLQGNLTNVVSGGGLVAAANVYEGFSDVERYVILGVGVAVLAIGVILFWKKLKKLADRTDF